MGYRELSIIEMRGRSGTVVSYHELANDCRSERRGGAVGRPSKVVRGYCVPRASSDFPMHFMSSPRAPPPMGTESGVLAGVGPVGC